ncbi:MAG: NAD(+) synthase [Kiritimatiellae bacterium]|nr:NAD(+) synthase [Kiritimatiellia bacterium]MDD5520127.1 NAD(+) synthase [Kiritimatiellia bacterium]
MKNKTIRTLLVQMEIFPGRPRINIASMLHSIENARTDGVELVVFPEMAIPGYLIGDEWEHESFLRECEECGSEICLASKGIIVVFGNVGLDWKKRNEDGRVRKYNALFVAENGKFVSPEKGPYKFVIKTLLPNYREFDDSRHFFDLRKLALEKNTSVEKLISPVKTSKLTLGCALCEDAWDIDYSLSPLNVLARKKIDLFLNISCSPFTVHKNLKRNRIFSTKAGQLKKPIVYVNNVGIQNNGKTVFTFDGSSCIYDTHGNQIICSPSFEEEDLTFDVPLTGKPFGDQVQLKEDGIAEIYRAIDYGTRKFMELCGIKRVTVGISGGIDSAVVASIYRNILHSKDLLLVNMPGKYNSQTTRTLAKELADNLQCCYAEVPIEESVKLTTSQINGITVRNISGKFSETLGVGPLMRENIQARDRSSRILAAISAAFGGVFTCNANKSEATVGYTTLYGDLCGYLANIADLWKTEVYQLAEYMNKDIFHAQIIPKGSFSITPSAELSDAQNVDEGKGDPLIYPYHDLLFKSWVESWNRTTPEEIISWYMEGKLETNLGYKGKISDIFKDKKTFVADLERWWNQYQGMGLVKRIQAPPVLAVKKRAFGFDHRESQMGSRYTAKYEKMKKLLFS